MNKLSFKSEEEKQDYLNKYSEKAKKVSGIFYSVIFFSVLAYIILIGSIIGLDLIYALDYLSYFFGSLIVVAVMYIYFFYKIHSMKKCEKEIENSKVESTDNII